MFRMYICMHIYIYIYISNIFICVYIGGWDCESNREIVFVSFVRACVRAGGRGEAKLCGRVRRCSSGGWVAAAGFVLLRGARGVVRGPPPRSVSRSE